MRSWEVRGGGHPLSQANPPPPSNGTYTPQSESRSGLMSPASRPSMDVRTNRPSLDRPGSTRPSLDVRPSYDGARTPSPLSASGPQRAPQMSAAPPGTVSQADGEVNMAGVGRRGFQAVAQAALLAASLGNDQGHDRMRMPTNGMDGRRVNAPRHLNINSNFANPCKCLFCMRLIDEP